MTRENHILAVGSIALDTIETSKGSRSNILGGSATYFGIAAALFAPVGLIGIVGDDFPESAIDLLKSKNIDLSNVQFKPGETFQWGGRYSSDYSSRETLFTKLGVFESFAPVVQCPENQSTYLFLGNIQPELQASVNDMLSDSKVVICDTMNLWIDNNPEELKQVLKKVDIFLLNDEEALQLTNQTDLQSAADSLRKIGPQIIVIKMGVKGALLVDATGSATIPVYPHVTVLDPTGAGDTFAGGFIGHICRNGSDSLVDAVISGAAIASFTVSGFGLEGLLEATQETLNERIKFIKQSMDTGIPV
ncbi:MAG: sugar kinase [Candidatus Marinimicrobia bacterium]|jgi:sugar/nucleoside kinase (ribokinase family)|nr:sugar kinase [Candidatus Neomarinimicrobiota bacterium]MBT3633138.1 sugar kinase [Candidatus Neomarinimicrobiota bacterium]MBT3682261.1 sugar kinase [Candidatus Neomarinimicrobiota bacterium]MBT3758738.1 sugar kinase [Candidatus Neomarinimicrobiota bacterium]MBT3895388.1 sugar kinase [Candidatus Neomarinimicrobiota bacterium]